MRIDGGNPAPRNLLSNRFVIGTLAPLVHEYIRQRVARGEITDSTARDNRSTLHGLSRSFGQRPMRQFGPAAIDRWLGTIGSLAPATRRRQLSAVRGFCKWLVDKRHIPKDPTEHVPPIRQPRRVPVTLRREDVARLLDACPDARARAIVHLMVGCGLRCVEVSRLTTADYDGEARTIVVVGKGGHQRIIPVPDTVAAALDEYLNEVGRTSGPLIRSEADDRAPLKAGTISIYTGRWIVAAGIKSRRWDGLSAHGLRRTAASDVMDRGADVRIVQAMLGHVKIETTAVYLRPVPLDRMREAMEGRDYTSSPAA